MEGGWGGRKEGKRERREKEKKKEQKKEVEEADGSRWQETKFPGSLLP